MVLTLTDLHSPKRSPGRLPELAQARDSPSERLAEPPQSHRVKVFNRVDAGSSVPGDFSGGELDMSDLLIQM